MPNILSPNFYATETLTSPNWKVSAGMTAKVNDSSGVQTITIGRGGKLDLDGAIGANLFIFEGIASSEIEVYRSGAEARVRWLASGESILSVNITATAQKLRFTDGDKDLVSSGGPKFDGQTILQDATVPVLSSVRASGPELTLIYGEELGSAVPPSSAFSVKVNNQTLPATDLSVTKVDGKTVFLALASAPASGSSISVSYTPPAASGLQDVGGNAALGFADVAVTSGRTDAFAPLVYEAITSGNGSKLIVSFSEDLSAQGPAVSRFTVTSGASAVGVSSVAIVGSTAELSLASPIAAGQSVTVAYADPSAADDSQALQDVAGNDVSTFTRPVTNGSVASSAPQGTPISILAPNFYATETSSSPNWTASAGMTAKVNDSAGPQTITIARGGKLDLDGALGANTFVFEGVASTEVEVYRSGAEARFRSLSSGETMLSVNITATAQKLVFTDGEKELVSSGGPKFGGVVISQDATAPAFANAALSGTSITLNFGEELAPVVPAATGFTVKVNGSALPSDGYAFDKIEGKTASLTLTSPVSSGASITVSYSATGAASGPLQDIGGNLVASFGDAAVTRVVADTTGPVFSSVSTASAPENQNLLYTAQASDASSPIVYSLSGTHASLLSINGASGAVTLSSGTLDFDAPNAQKSYSFNVIATDAKGNPSTQPVTVSVNNVTSDDPAPTALALTSSPYITPGNTTVSGTAVAGSTVKVFVGSVTGELATATADTSGKWAMSITPGNPLVAGFNELRFTAAVGSGTPSQITEKFVYTPGESWTASTIKNVALRTEIDSALGTEGKINHAEAVGIVNKAIEIANGTSALGGKIGDQLLSDLRALGSRGGTVFSSADHTGKESGYLTYVFNGMVNSSPANAVFTGGDSTVEQLGNLNASSPIGNLGKLRDKWLLGLDRPNPATQGDSANAQVGAATGIYKAFSGSLVATSGDSAGFNAFDVTQGSAGTCYLLAAIAAIAETETIAKQQPTNANLNLYRTAFEQVFVKNDAATPTYGVRFFDQNGKPFWVTVDNQLVVRSESATAPSYTKLSAAGELWAPLIEKAYAQANEFGAFGRTKSDNSMMAIEGGLAEPMAFLLGGAVSYFADKNELYRPNFFGTGLAANQRVASLSQEINGGESIFVGSWKEVKIDGSITFVSGHAYMAYDANRSLDSNTDVKVYNPWGVSASGYHISPFDSTLSNLLTDPGFLPLFHTPTAPKWVSDYFGKVGAAKAVSSAPSNSSAAAQLEAYSSGSLAGKSFLTLPTGKSLAVSNNNTPAAQSVQDDRSGLFDLTGNELLGGTNVLTVFVGAKPGQTPALTATELAGLKDAIVAASNATAFRTAVNTAMQTADVRFGIQFAATAQADIAGDAALEKGIVVGLSYPTTSSGDTVTFGVARETGEVAQAKVATGAAPQVRNTPIAAEERIVSIDGDTNTVLYVDGKEGHWQVGEKGKAVTSFIYLTIDGSAVGGTGAVRLNDDTLEVTALHARAIGGAPSGWVAADLDGFEVTVRANEFEDQFYTLYFDATGQLVSAEYLSDEELIDVEQEADIDVNDNGGLGDVDFFVAEGFEGAPDLYVNAANDLVLIDPANPSARTPITAGQTPVSYWDLDEDTLITLVLPDKDAPAGVKQYLLVVQLGDSGVATVRVLADGILELDTDGEVVVRMLDENESAALSERIGIDVTGEGDIELVNEVIGDSGDNIFDMHQRSGDLLFVDTAGDDVYLSGDGDDVLLGVLPGDADFAVRGDNRFLGGDGDDLYAGFTVGDMFYGGPGSDLAIIDGLSTGYTWIAATPQQVTAARALDPTVTSGYVVQDKLSSAQGFLWNVEALEFNGNDQTIDLNPLVP